MSFIVDLDTLWYIHKMECYLVIKKKCTNACNNMGESHRYKVE